MLMRMIAMVLAFGSIGRTEPSQPMVDPLFGISYNPHKVMFESAPKSIGELCADLRGRRLWIYGSTYSKGIQYFIVSGFVRHHPDGRGSSFLEPDQGIAVALQGNKCIYDQSDFFMTGEINPAKDATPIKASSAVLNSIAANVFRRYAKAFGGKKEFLGHIALGDLQYLPTVLQRQLELEIKKTQFPSPGHSN